MNKTNSSLVSMLTWEDSIKPFVPEVKDRSEDSSSEDCVVAHSLGVIFHVLLNETKYLNIIMTR